MWRVTAPLCTILSIVFLAAVSATGNYLQNRFPILPRYLHLHCRNRQLCYVLLQKRHVLKLPAARPVNMAMTPMKMDASYASARHAQILAVPCTVKMALNRMKMAVLYASAVSAPPTCVICGVKTAFSKMQMVVRSANAGPAQKRLAE